VASPLSLRERQVLDLIALGNSNAEIGRALFMSEASVKTIVHRLLGKLGARTRAHAVHLGYQLNLFAGEDS
jgi:ATP/maltotriose-dependent transcriptional regulator MalT